MRNETTPTFIAAVYRAEYLALAVFSGPNLLEVRQHRIATRAAARISQALVRLAADYGAAFVLTEPAGPAAEEAARLLLPVHKISFEQGNGWRIGSQTFPSAEELCRTVVARLPELKRLVTVYKNTGNVSMDAWNITQLYAVALGQSYAEEQLNRLPLFS